MHSRESHCHYLLSVGLELSQRWLDSERSDPARVCTWVLIDRDNCFDAVSLDIAEVFEEGTRVEVGRERDKLTNFRQLLH